MRKSSKRFLSTALALSMVAGLIVPANAATYQGAEVYDHVLGIYEDDFQDNVRFTDDGVADVTGQEWYADSETVGVNRERAKTQFVSYQDTDTALAAEKSVMDEVGPETSAYYMLLSGKDWDFAMVTNPEEAAKVDAEYLAEEYTGSAFQPEYVPQPWQTYRNEDGTFKYDEPMYTNQIFPWQEWETLDYWNPHAPTVYNPVGYYRTTFTTPDNWDGREIFISFQSVESAYYLYVNGKPVGYSTDSFTAHDFNITDYLNPNGEENTIALKVFRWSIGSWLENQDFIRESGIYRDVYLYSKDEVEIRDFFFNTEFDDRADENSNVTVTVDTTLRGLYNAAEGQYTVSSYIVDNDGNTVATADDQTVTIGASAAKSAEDVLRDEGTTVTSEMYVENPAKWFPDTPNLYSLVLELKNSDGEVMESVVERVGFREIYKIDIDAAGHEQMQITGRQMILRGVNRHDTDLETGHALTYEDYFTDLTLMKQYNLNAIRTSHYPNDQVLYDLADELGIYVCAEANIESHAAASNGIKVPSGTGTGLPEWVPPVLDRVATNLERYKNHASIVIWSLGNEATYSQNTLNDDYSFWVASMYLLARDPSRLRKYERESDNYYGHAYTKAEGADPWSTDVRKYNIVDVQSTQYALPSGVAGYNGKMPYIHSEYNHAMGQSYGNAKEHWDVIRDKDNVQGGFIWDYIDQSIRTVRDNGDGTYDEFWGYGGDWIDTKRNDNAFCGNGLVYADRTPSPKLEEARKVHQQVNFYADDLNVTPGGSIDVQVVNEFEATNLDAYEITWTLTENSIDTLASGTLNLSTPHIDGISLDGDNTETVTIQIPADVAPVEGSDYLLTFSVKLKTATAWAEADYEIAYEQFELSFDAPEAQTEVVTDKDFTDVQTIGSEMILTGQTDYGQTFEITLNTKLGTIVSYKLDGEVVMTAGPEQSYYRAETYNDTTVTKDARLKNAGDPENMTNLSVSATRSGNTVVMAMSGTMAVPASSLMAYVIYGNGEIVVLDQFIPSSNFASGGLPKIGSRMEISGDYDNLTYYGRGPQESYVDRKSGALVGVYTDTVYDPNDAMGADSSWEGKKMLKPQDNDNRTDVRWTALTNDAGTGLMVTADDVVEISALHYTAEEMNSQTYNNAQYRHPNQVPQKDEIVWSIDLHQNGVSDTAFMGHRPLDGYRFATDRSYSYSYRISPIQLTDVSAMMDKGSEAFPVPSSSYPITGIYINGNAVAGFDVDTSVVSSYTLSANEGVEVTVDGTSDFEVVYNEDGTISVIAANNYGQKFEYRVQLAREGTELPYTIFSGVKVNNNYSGQVAGNIIDGNAGTIWHSDWTKTTPMSTLWFMVELSEATDINGIRYLPRSDSNNFNGAYGDHDIYVSDKPISELTGDPSSADWTYVGSGSWAKGSGWKSTALNEVVNAKSVMVVPKTTYGDTENAWGSCAEFRVTAASVVDTANLSVELDESYVYAGSPVCPDPVVTLDGMRLIRGVDYTVAYENNDVTSGTGSLTVTLCGAFSGDPVSKTFAITEGDQYTVTVENGTEESITAYVGQTVTVTAAEAAEGTMFDAWTSTDEAVAFADPSSESTTFVMPDHDVTVTATYVAAYNVTVVGGTLDEEGAITSQKYKVGSTITVYAKVPEGKVFDHWETDGEDAVIVDTARDPAIMNATPARDIVITAVFKTDESYFEIVDELPSYAYLGQTFTAPETIKVIKGDQEIDAAVTWNEGQLNAINAATEVGAYTLSGSVEGHDITCTITVVPGDVVYFVDAGADEFTALGQAIVDYNGDTILNTTTDQAYTAESGWGYTNPESEVETNYYSTDVYSTIRNMTDSKNTDPNDGRGKPLFYQFDGLTAGTYDIYVGYKNIWYQTNYQRNATIELISNDVVLATAEKNLNVQDGEYVKLEAVMTDAGSLTLKMKPKENVNANNDMLVSFIAIIRTEGDEPVPTPETYTVTFLSDGAEYETAEVEEGDVVSVPDSPEKEGYTFTGWYTDEACTEAYDFSVPVTGDLTLYAGWQENAPEVVPVTGVSLDAAELTLTEGETANLTATVEPENATDKSVTWTSSDEGVATVADGKVTAVAAGAAEITVTTVDGGFTATCTVTVNEKPEDSFTVRFVSDGETYQNVNVTAGETVAEPTAPVKDGYTFTGWYTDEACTEAYDFSAPVTGDITLYAGWEENAPEITYYTVTFNTNGGSEIAPVEVEEGQAVERPADPSNGSFTFNGWYTDAACTEAYDFSAGVTEDITLYAGWKMTGHEGSSGSGTVTPDEPDVDEPDVDEPDTDIDDDDTPLNPAPTFTDVADGYWGKEAIDYVVSEGLFQGTSATTFAPEMLTTRGMIMTVLARMDGVDTSESDPWYQAGMEWAVAEGVSDGTNPEATISREQLATMLYRYFGSPEVSEEALSFSDADQVSEWASAGVRWAVANGIISGKGNNVLDPLGNATRAEVAQMLYNYSKIG